MPSLPRGHFLIHFRACLLFRNRLVSRPFDPAQLLGFLGVRERVRGHPRGDGVGSYDHEQRARCDHGDKPERIEARYAIDAIPGKELG